MLNKKENYTNAFYKILYSVRDYGTYLIARYCTDFIPKVKLYSKMDAKASTLPSAFYTVGRI